MPPAALTATTAVSEELLSARMSLRHSREKEFLQLVTEAFQNLHSPEEREALQQKITATLAMIVKLEKVVKGEG